MYDGFLIEDDLFFRDRALTIRPARVEDRTAIEQLGELSEQDPATGPHLLADENGEIVAALSLTDGTTVADPFRHTAATVGLLRLRAEQLTSSRRTARAPRLRRLATVFAVASAFAIMSAVAAAATATVTVAGKPVAINTASKRIAVGVTCLGDSRCTGVLDVKTAGRIKPYSSQPAAIAAIGAFPFSIAPGATALVKGRVYGHALAEAMLRGRVRVSITPRATGGDLAPPKIVVFTYRRA